MRQTPGEGQKLPELAQLVITDEQALQVAQALSLALENSTEEQIGGEEAEHGLKQLSVFFGLVAANPERFPVSGRLAKAIKSAKRSALKGPAQPSSRRNKRKARQEKRQGGAKRRRTEKQETTAAHNAAREAIERDMAEMEEVYQARQDRLAELLSKDDFTMVDLTELLSLSGAPEEILSAAQRVGPPKPELYVAGQ